MVSHFRCVGSLLAIGAGGRCGRKKEREREKMERARVKEKKIYINAASFPFVPYIYICVYGVSYVPGDPPLERISKVIRG